MIDAEVVSQMLLNIGARKLWVAVWMQQALFGCDQRTLTVHVKGTAFHNQGRSVSIQIGDFQHFLRYQLVQIPWEIHHLLQAAPGVKHPVDAAYVAGVIDDECGAAVSDPGIIVW